MFSSLSNRIKQTTLSRVEIALLLLLLIGGLPMIILIPPGAGYDEEDHLVRVWELSAFSFIPGQMSPQELRYPTVFRDFAYRQQGSAGVIESAFWRSYSRTALYERGFVHREIDTKSVYSPALLLPQAIAMRLFGRSVELPALPAFYLSRLAGLLSYLLLTWLAIRWMPFGKWILLVLALSPMALFQAATLSPDAISNGIGFLFVAGCLHLARDQEIDGKETTGLLLLISLLFLAKLNIIPLLLLPFLLMPPSRFSSRGLYGFLLAMTLILFLVEVAGWNWVASRNFDSLLLDEANPAAQVRYILTHPFAFLQTLLNDLAKHGFLYLQGWVNGYGYYYWTPPLIVSLLFLVGLGFAVFRDPTFEHIHKKARVILILVFLAGYVATIASLYISFAPVGSDHIFGVQGRYFIPLMLPVVLVLASFVQTRQFAYSKWLPVFLIAALSLNGMGLFFSFHVPCGSTYYQTGLCYRPLFRDFPGEARSSPALSNAVVLDQEITVACNGFGELRVLVKPSTPGDTGVTHFILQNAATGQRLLQTLVRNDQMLVEDWYSLRFDPDWESAGRRYTLRLLGENSPPGQGIQFLYTTQPEFDLGNLYEGGQLRQEDIVLQYGCVTGLRKIWLTGKP